VPRGVRRALLVLLLCLVTAGLGLVLTPLVYRGLVGAGLLAPEKFLKVLRRMLLVPVLLVLFAALRPWRDGGPSSYGLLGPRARLGPGLVGFALSATAALGLLTVHFLSGWIRWEDPMPWMEGIRRAVWWLGAGVVLGLLEEWFFRGWLDRRLRARFSPAWSAVIVAVLFATLHAFKPSALEGETTRDVAGAWHALVGWIAHLFDLETFGPAFVGLCLFSLLQTALWRRTKTLWTPIGVHAAAIWVVRAHGGFTARDVERTWMGTKGLYDGPPAWALLLLALWLVTRRRSRGGPAEAAPPPV
jgi:CAAX protease family protein